MEWEETGLAPVRLALAIQRGASGKAAPQVRLSEEGAHRRALHGWLTVCPWQLVIYHCWAAMSGGNVINFTLPFSEISPINHPKLGLCAGFRCRPGLTNLYLVPPPRLGLVLPLKLRQKESLCHTDSSVMEVSTWWQTKKKKDRYTCPHINLYGSHKFTKCIKKKWEETGACHRQILTPALSI